MLTNATILRIDAPLPATTGGASAWTNGNAMSCRCYLRDTTADTFEGDATRAVKRSGDLRVQPRQLAFALAAAGYSIRALAEGQRVLVISDGDMATLHRVRMCGLNAGGSLSFYEAKLLQD